MIDLIDYKGKTYPKFQSQGPASQYCFPFALQVCKGKGLDIGCSKIEWSFPGSIPIDTNFNNEYNAFNLPAGYFDYIFSSHCLEHLENWVDAMDIWHEKLVQKGVLFLYLPDYSQEYWRPWNNRKHKHCFTNKIIHDYMKDKGYKNIFYSEPDLLNSFMIFGEKQ